MATREANAAHRKSNKRIEDKTWLKSICRKTYQKHAAVTRSFTAKIAAFLPPPPAGRLVVPKSLVTRRSQFCWEGRLCGIVMAERNAKFKP
jgi:hypothetical protein